MLQYIPLAYNQQNRSHTAEQRAYLICEWDREVQYLAIQLPFGLILHVGDLNFNSNRALERVGSIDRVKTERCTG